jgi:transcriptional regulator with XRE-family HTH domain
MRTLDQIINGLSVGRRSKIAARTQQLIAEEMALRHLRQARDLTQQTMAELLDIDQAGISKIESRSDMLLSTLRSYVKAMGGSLRLLAEFPDGIVELSSLGEALDTNASERAAKTKKTRQSKHRRPQLIPAND